VIAKTKGIVLRAVKYGETSLVVTVFTEMLGIQSYLVQGVRKSGKTGQRAIMLQPGALLTLDVYHSERKQLHRIRECAWSYVPAAVLSDVVKNCIALYWMEILQKCLQEPEPNSPLFSFCEDMLMALDRAEPTTTASINLFFLIHFSRILGFGVTFPVGPDQAFWDYQEGHFTEKRPAHPHYTDDALTVSLKELLCVMHPDELAEITLTRADRHKLLDALQMHMASHVRGMSQLKSLPIVREILS
jgi:DNA repair protein RecO (recombination protein O)